VVVVSLRALLLNASAAGVLAGAVGTGACKPEVDLHTFRVDRARILAVRTEPAEAPPKQAIRLSALYVDPSGTLSAGPIDWAFCNERKPLAELSPVNPACMTREGEEIVPIGQGTTVDGAIPELACRNFGSDVPPPEADGGTGGRPVDPDQTGGFYQPIRIALATPSGDELTLDRTRIVCGIANVSKDLLAEYKSRYHANTNPDIESVGVVEGGSATPLPLEGDGNPPRVVAPGARITLRASWPVCTAAPCTGAETYVAFEVAAQALVDRPETLRVSWFSTDGSFDNDRTGREPGDSTPFVDNVWVAPDHPGTVHLWAVLRDDRGGVGWKGFAIDVR
jgi:hypothetical protein